MIDVDDMRLRLYPDPVLRVKADPVGEVTAEVRRVAERMIEIMRDADGIGLAAPQAGVDLRIFVCEVPPPPADILQELDLGEHVHISTDGAMVCIDPDISEPSDERSTLEEGCLSLPGLRGDVIRPETVTLSATGLDGKRFDCTGTGLLAKCWQHELDHLNGVLIIDRMTQMSRMKNRRKLRDMERRV